MALNEHLKQAAQMLRRAATDKRQEVNDLRRQIDELKHVESKRITDIKSMEQRMQSMMGTARSDVPVQTDKALLMRQLSELKKEESNLHNEINKRIQELTNEINHRSNDANGLEHQASDFDVKAGMSTIF